MIIRYLIIFSYIFIFSNIQAFLNIFNRSESTQLKERCGHSILLNNTYWLLKQTRVALENIRLDKLAFDQIPWDRLAQSIQRISEVCSIDEIKDFKTRMFIREKLVKTGTLLAKKTQRIADTNFIRVD